MKQTLLVLGQAPSDQLERQLLKDYREAASQTSDESRYQQKQSLDQSMLSDLSQLSSHKSETYSDQFYNRWSGFLYSADQQTTSQYMDPIASWMLPSNPCH